MPIDALVRCSFQSDGVANNECRTALVGNFTSNVGSGEFVRVNTGAFQSVDGDTAQTLQQLIALLEVYANHPGTIDYLSIELTKTRGIDGAAAHREALRADVQKVSAED